MARTWGRGQDRGRSSCSGVKRRTHYTETFALCGHLGQGRRVSKSGGVTSAEWEGTLNSGSNRRHRAQLYIQK